MSTATATANPAAADAAREARAEATVAPKPARAAKAAAEWLTFDVTVWLTSFNSIEFGFYKNSRNRAKSRQFTTDIDRKSVV